MQKEELPELDCSPSLSKKKSSMSIKPDDFSIKYRLGKGAYGDVYLVTKTSDGKQYAMKQILKRKLQKQKKQYQALIEKQLLTTIKHPGIVKLKYAFQDTKILYFILELCEGGQFTEFIKLNIKLLTQQAKVFYIAQIVNLLQYLHTNGLTHRDIKPENMMLDCYGHLKLIDFGTADISNSKITSKDFKDRILKLKQKEQEQLENEQPQFDPEDEDVPPSPKKKERRSTFVGTCYYISPELLEKNQCPPSADLWALGCIIYQLYYLEPPFKDTYEFAVFEKIKKAEIHFPHNESITPETVDIIQKLLVKDPDQRLGCGSNEQLTYSKLKSHPFFAGLDIDNIFTAETPEIPNLIVPEKSEQAKKQDRQRIVKNNEQLIKKVSQQLSQHKDIVMHGIVERRTFITHCSCYLILYENATLVKITNDTADERKVLHLKIINEPAKLINQHQFQVRTTHKVYHFESNIAEKWVGLINEQHAKNPYNDCID